MTPAKNLLRSFAILLTLFVCESLLLPADLLAAQQQAAEQTAAEQDKKQVLFVCHSISFIHPAVVPAEKALRKLGRQHGFELTCFRYTHDTQELATKTSRIYGRKTEVGKPLLGQYSGKRPTEPWLAVSLTRGRSE